MSLETEFPIRTVTLYKHGVGAFERTGRVVDDQVVRLSFKTSEMNDVLKSLTVIDEHGVLSSISYETEQPREKQIADIHFRLPKESAITGTLAALAGSTVKITLRESGTTVTGVILGTERTHTSTGDHNRVALLVEGTSLRYHDVDELSNVEFLDAAVQKDIMRLLELQKEKTDDFKSLTLYTKGSGARSLTISYVVETPSWKTSYRVLFNTDTTALQQQQKEGEPASNTGNKLQKSFLQGWAIVDNTQDSDWEDVSLTLVSGQPISFVHNLYEPRYRDRTEVPVEGPTGNPFEFASNAANYRPRRRDVPQPLSSSLAAQQPFARRGNHPFVPPQQQPMYQQQMMPQQQQMMPQQMMNCMPSMPMPPPQFAGDMQVDDVFGGTAVVSTETEEVGDLFSYRIRTPVSVKRNQAALVPILQSAFDGKPIALFNGEVRPVNPMSSIYFANSTGMTLEGGPVTVFDGSMYVGEGMMETCKPLEVKIIPYSIEKGVTVTVNHKSEVFEIRSLKIAFGVARLAKYSIAEVIYVCHNKTSKPIELLIEHRFRKGWDLIDTPKYVNPDPKNYYRFVLELPPQETVRFPVKERSDVTESINLDRVDKGTIEDWLRNRLLDEVTRSRLLSVRDLMDQRQDIERRVVKFNEEISGLEKHQSRVRQNIQTLPDTPQRKQLIQQLTDLEARLQQNQANIDRSRGEQNRLQELIDRSIKELQFASPTA